MAFFEHSLIFLTQVQCVSMLESEYSGSSGFRAHRGRNVPFEKNRDSVLLVFIQILCHEVSRVPAMSDSKLKAISVLTTISQWVGFRGGLGKYWRFQSVRIKET